MMLVKTADIGEERSEEHQSLQKQLCTKEN